VAVGLRNPFESLHPVLKLALHGLFGITASISRIAALNSSSDRNAILCRQYLRYPKKKKPGSLRVNENSECTATRSSFAVPKVRPFELYAILHCLHEYRVFSHRLAAEPEAESRKW
jgi:hypothetical protein